MLFLIRLLVNAVALWVATRIVSGLSFDGPPFMLVAVALVFGAVNAIVRPVVKIFTFPILILTLGLFIFVINALMLWLTGRISEQFGFGFHVAGFGAAFLGALAVSIVSFLLTRLVREKKGGMTDQRGRSYESRRNY
jgi:putative membrane protein